MRLRACRVLIDSAMWRAASGGQEQRVFVSEIRYVAQSASLYGVLLKQAIKISIREDGAQLTTEQLLSIRAFGDCGVISRVSPVTGKDTWGIVGDRRGWLCMAWQNIEVLLWMCMRVCICVCVCVCVCVCSMYLCPDIRPSLSPYVSMHKQALDVINTWPELRQ